MFRLLGVGGTVVGVMVIGAASAWDRSANFFEVEGEIYRIDRKCKFDTQRTVGGKVVERRWERSDCSSTDEFAQIKKSRNKVVDGSAVVKIGYKSPVDGSYRTGELTFTGRDDSFYTMKAHQKLKILVSKTDPSKIRL